ncbi:MAG: hypothetical protein ABS871_02535 [Methanobrevibacter sp.]
MYRKLLIALIIIVLVVLGGLIVFSNGNSNSNADTKINFLSNKTLQNGDSVVFELTDSKGNVLANQELKIKFTSSSGESQNFTITTDNLGKGKLVLNEQENGNYTVTVTYAGDSSHKGCSANQTITIGYVNAEQTNSTSQPSSSSQSTSASSSSSSSSSSDLKYDSELNVHYDSNGKIVGGQSDGADYNYVRDHQISGHDLE